MEKIEFKVEGMDCGGCVKSVTRMLTGTAGVVSVDVSLEGAKAAVEFDPTKTSLPELKRAVERAGFKAP
ncbi:MAG: heavy-metal-associated domain-containing protein [Proteobacteria bacterium]|nr:heavy-metal-associated domain-containing protein [Pseudomonadota bacterium]